MDDVISIKSGSFTLLTQNELFTVEGGWGWKETAIAVGAVMLAVGVTVATGGAGALVGAALYGSASGFTVVGAASVVIDGIALAGSGAGIIASVI